MGDILCATYSLWLRERATGRWVSDCDLGSRPVSGQWQRVLGDTSGLNVTFDLDPNVDCCDCLPVELVDEIVVERHSPTGDRIVWEGPVVSVVTDRTVDQLRIEAFDASWWWGRRQAFERSATLTNVDPVEVWAAVRADQDLVDPSGLIVVPGAPVRREVTAEWGQYDSTLDQLNPLTDVRWTVVAGELWGPGATTAGTEPFGTFDTADDWVTADQQGGPITTGDGATRVARVVVIGANDLRGVFPADPAPGLGGYHFARVVRADLDTQARVDAEAEAIWGRNSASEPNFTTGEASLRSTADVCVADLVPGRRWRVSSRAACGGDDPVNTVELTQVLGDFATDPSTGDIVETRVAVDLGPVGLEADESLFSV